MLEFIGWCGAVCFGLCCFPQCYKVYQTHSTKDLSWVFFGMWFTGEILSFIYVIITNIQVGEYQYPLLGNYLFNFLCLCYLIGAKLKYDNVKEISAEEVSKRMLKKIGQDVLE